MKFRFSDFHVMCNYFPFYPEIALVITVNKMESRWEEQTRGKLWHERSKMRITNKYIDDQDNFKASQLCNERKFNFIVNC
ncbi:CLUMA_CG009737, isoform A [Clunio marinus]|uniref:CLUMA_CG009737, isoform A n=1 Tax=Clunio marinus TaxID=568069 RepID=A0A1J1IBG3_9DIPT|nr:CLUMA_CG009737, isoform A [Clunio marinus]